MIDKIEWWKLACEKSPSPISFVGLDNRFVFCNQSWCHLLGYSESELRQKTWQEITLSTDIGGDNDEVESIRAGDKTEYYLEKTYIQKSGRHIHIKLYVHRYPEYGELQGFIVFAQLKSSQEYDDLKAKFLDLHKTVILLQQKSVGADLISSQIKLIETKLEQNKELIAMALARKDNSVNIGDSFAGNSNTKSGRDSIINANTNILLFLASFLAVILVAILAILLVYVF